MSFNIRTCLAKQDQEGSYVVCNSLITMNILTKNRVLEIAADG